MDRVDIRLLREILQGRTTLPLTPQFRRPFRAISRILKIDEDVVRRRVLRLEETGFVVGWRLILNPNILGMAESVVDLDVPKSVFKEDLISKLKFVPGVFLIANFYGSFLGIIFRYDQAQSARRTIDLIQALAEVDNIHCAGSPWPECRTNLSKTDWKIIASLYENPRKSHVSIAEDTGISSRTVNRRLRNMVGDAMLFAICAISPKALEGTILANLGVGYERAESFEVHRRVTERLGEFIWHVYHTVPANETDLQYTWFNLALPNLSKAHEISDWVKDQQCAKTCRIEFYEDHTILLEAFDEQLQRKLSQL